MKAKARIFSLQMNPIVGDIARNLDGVYDHVRRSKGCDILLTSELVSCGYPPEDLILRPHFIDDVMDHVHRFARKLTADDPAVILGTPWKEGEDIFNAAVVIDGPNSLEVRHKTHLPNYGVFDEKRVFTASKSLPDVVRVRGLVVGMPICEDIWREDVCDHLKSQGAQLLLVLNSSPYKGPGTLAARHDVARARVAAYSVPLVYVNQVGGQDEIVFDGGSFVLDRHGQIIDQSPMWVSDGREIELNLQDTVRTSAHPFKEERPESDQDRCEEVYTAVMIGLRDYVNKNKFPGVVLGLSGGIDSALSLAIAVDALGAERVRAVMMPSQYTSSHSIEDAHACADALGVALEVVSIEEGVSALERLLSHAFEQTQTDTTEENIQARLRGVLLMAISNKFGYMVLTTGNKSEMAVGYATLYGDMCGGYSVLKDIYKSDVFKLAWWRNRYRSDLAFSSVQHVMPERVITKPPSAELRFNQTDQDSLPPYEVLDHILYDLVEQKKSILHIVNKGYEKSLVENISTLLKRSEYKRRQSAPGVKVSSQNFGRDWRYPLTNHAKY